MAKQNLKDEDIENLGVPRGGTKEITDREVRGLRLRRYQNGRKVWVQALQVPQPGGRPKKQVQKMLGEWPAMDTEAARNMARANRKAAQRGNDPFADGADDRAVYFRELADAYAEHVKKNAKSFDRNTKPYLYGHLVPALGDLPLDSINRQDIRRLVDAKRKTAPIAANRLLEVAKAAFNYGVDEEMLSASPVADLKRPEKEKPRQRVLTVDEIRAIWNAADGLDFPYGPLVKMWFLTGQRELEVANAVWAEFNLEDAAWFLPPERSKAERTHFVPLSGTAVDLLNTLPKLTGPHLFSFQAGKNPIAGFGGLKKKLDKASGVENWRLHDIRRTVGTNLGRWYGNEIVGACLNHAKTGVTATRYNLYEYEAEKRQALDRWAARLDQIVSGGGKVVRLRDGAA